ncbi:hypothetical protein QE152_g35054 [Popillia japonica]|uniref:Uncharacterized protein n=1 Tax=Popillia japonica TaxID=7064 RepID=A0AAW1IRT3_POPJA
MKHAYSQRELKQNLDHDNVKSVRTPEGYNGKGFIVVHASTADGFIDSASLIFSLKSIAGDMNSELFKQWTMEKLIPNLEELSLVILDDAPCRTVVLNKPPTSLSKKCQTLSYCNW